MGGVGFVVMSTVEFVDGFVGNVTVIDRVVGGVVVVLVVGCWVVVDDIDSVDSVDSVS